MGYSSGHGTLKVDAGGVVSNTDGEIASGDDSTGTVTVTGTNSKWENSSRLYVGGTNVGAGGNGTLNIFDSGLVDVAGLTKLWSGGTVNLNGGTLDTGILDIREGTFNMLGGILRTSHISGNLNVQGGKVAPGNSPGILAITGDYAQGAAATLEIELGGTVRDSEYDALIVSGDMTLDGGLDVLSIDGFVPQAGDAFDILDFTPANLSGTFSAVNLPALASDLAWDQTNLYTSGNLLVISPGPNPCGLGGDAGCSTADLDALYAVFNTNVPPTDAVFDLNSDNLVDAADLNEWLSLAATENGHSSAYLRGDTDLDRNVDLADYSALAINFDPTGSLGPHGWNDGNSDGDNDVDLADYNALASNFSPAGYGAAPVPEPTSVCLLLAGLLVLARVRF